MCYNYYLSSLDYNTSCTSYYIDNISECIPNQN